MSLIFEYRRCCYNGSQDGGNDLILEQWGSALANLLESMIGKCTSLTIRGGEIMKDAYSVFILPSRARDFNQPSKFSLALRAAKRPTRDSWGFRLPVGTKEEVLCGQADIGEAIDVIRTSNPQLQSITFHGETCFGGVILPMSN